MHPLVLTKRVDIEGPDLFGRPGKISFCPQIKGGCGWLWDIPGMYLAINANTVEYANRRLRLRSPSGLHKVEICEHLLFLRWLGLCDVVMQSTSWPPYHSCSGGLWQKVKQHCKIDDTSEITWHTLRGTAYWKYPYLRNGHTAFTEIEPNNVSKLEVKIVVRYKGIGGYELNFTLPDKDFLERICVIGNQGIPKYLYYFSRTASAMGWPHHNTAVWPQENTMQRTIERFAFHRAADLLGALGLLCRGGLLAGRVTSICSGHEADFHVIQEADKMVCPLLE